MCRLTLILVLLILSTRSYAAEVLFISESGKLVAVSHPNSRRWKITDYVCMLRNRRKLACGHVVKSLKPGAIIALSFQKETPNQGDRAIKTEIIWEEPESKDRSPSSLNFDLHQVTDRMQRNYLVSIGVVIASPIVNFEAAISPNLTLGLFGTTLSTSILGAAQTGYGGMISFNYYFNEPFTGPTIQLAGGMYYATAILNETSSSFPAFSSRVVAGHRWRWEETSLHVGVGVSYFYMRQNTVVTSNQDFILPVVQFDFGTIF